MVNILFQGYSQVILSTFIHTDLNQHSYCLKRSTQNGTIELLAYACKLTCMNKTDKRSKVREYVYLISLQLFHNFITALSFTHI